MSMIRSGLIYHMPLDTHCTRPKAPYTSLGELSLFLVDCVLVRSKVEDRAWVNAPCPLVNAIQSNASCHSILGRLVSVFGTAAS